MHRLQGCAFQLWPRDIEGLQCLDLTVIDISRQRRGQLIIPDDPDVIRIIARQYAEITRQLIAQPCKRAAQIIGQKRPFIGQVIDRISLDHTGLAIADRAADIGLVILCDKSALAACHILGIKRGCVAPAAIEPVKHAAIIGVACWRCGHRIFHRGAGERRILDRIVRHAEIVCPAIGILRHRHAQCERVIRHKACVEVVFINQRQLARIEVEQMHVMELRIAIVEADQDTIADGL